MRPVMRRTAGLLLAALLATAGGAAAQQSIPVLCYHGFVEAGEPIRGQLTESLDRFEAMLRFLVDEGFETVFPEEVAAGAAPERAVVITFDDGRREQLRAAELLEAYGFRGIFFVIPARLEDERPDYLSREDVARLAAAGHRVAPHGFAHRNMIASGRETAQSMGQSVKVVSSVAGADHPVADFAFPFGHYDDAIAAALSHRYPFLHTVNPGYWDGVSTMVPRMLIARDVPLEFYTDYIASAAQNAPAGRLLSVDGAAGGTAEFRLEGDAVPPDLRMLVISPDRDGRMYAAHRLEENAWIEGDRLVVDVRAHLERHYPEERDVVGYALVTRDARGTRFLTPGYLQWLEPIPTSVYRGPLQSRRPLNRAGPPRRAPSR